ncbi:MAG: hypothetical protein J5986_05010 [Roseburia sp.]|nr:hypothetical protein [Roseburia sp.]
MSVYGYSCDMREGTRFRNVNDSTDDPVIDGMGWIQLWENRTGLKRRDCCACGENTKTIVGGHVVLGSGNCDGDAPTDSESLFGGKRVFIVPICTACNGKSEVFRAKFSTRIVHLAGYGVDSRFNEGKYASEHFELDNTQLRVEIAQKRNAYAHYLWTKYGRQRVLNGRDQQILDMAVPSLRSRPSKGY